MELQRVLAHDTRKAMEKVYELYGEDAMVVSNSRTHNQTEQEHPVKSCRLVHLNSKVSNVQTCFFENIFTQYLVNPP